MKHSIISRAITGLAIAAGAAGAFAHEGHGQQGPHWHATDSFGLLLVGLLAGVAVWMSGRK